MGVGSSLPAPSFPFRREILAQGGSLLVPVCLVGGGGVCRRVPMVLPFIPGTGLTGKHVCMRVLRERVCV